MLSSPTSQSSRLMRSSASSSATIGSPLLPYRRRYALATRDGLQLLVALAPGKGLERLALTPLVQVGGHRALHVLGGFLRRHAPQDRPADGRVRAEPAPQVDLVGLQLALIAIAARRRALQADIRDPVVSTGMWAAVDAQLEPLHLPAEALLQPQHDLLELRLGSRHREVAQRLAGAGYACAAQPIDLKRKTDLGHPRDHLVQACLRDAGQDEVLLPAQADVAAVGLREIGQLDRLLPADPPQEDWEAHIVQPLLLLAVDAQVVRMARGRGDGGQILQPAAQALFDFRAHP